MAELIKVNAPVRKPLFEGVQGENEARSIQFDIEPWVTELGNGAVTATAKRSQDSQPYPVTVTKDGNIVTWKPTSTDTAFAGVGSFQLEYTVDSVLAKTCIWSTMVAPSLDPAGDPPDPYDNWLAEMREIAADAIQAAQDADASADDAQAEVYEAEAWAKGTKNGTPVSSADAQYQNNAKYFSEESYKNAEAWAVGQRGGVDVPSTDPTYENNAKYWAGQAEDLKDATQAIVDEARADVFEAMDGLHEETTAGSALQLISDKYTEDQVPYLFRKSIAGDRELDTLVGGSIAWNQFYSDSRAMDGFDPSNTVRSYDASADKTIVSATVGASGYGYVSKAFTPKLNNIYVISFKAKASSGVTYIWAKPSSSSNTPQSKTYSGEKVYTFIQKVDDASVGASLFGYSAPNGTSVNVEFSKANIFNLTTMFGTAVADRLYQMEQATAGSGVAWFRERFPKDYYAYNSGELMSVKTSAHEMVGFNQWDEVAEAGSFDGNGQEVASTTAIRSKNYIPILPNTAYFFHCGSTDAYLDGVFYDADKNIVDVKSGASWGVHKNSVFTTPANAHYMRFAYPSYGNTYKSDICISISSDRNGEYQPYTKHTYALDDVELRGVMKLDGTPYFDGDTYEADGTVTRRYGIVDLGTLAWNYRTGGTPYFSGELPGSARPDGNFSGATWNAFCTKYRVSYWNDSSDKIISHYATSDNIAVIDSAYTDAVTFKSAVSGVYLVYELATPTTETADPFTNPQIVDAYGTERYVDERTVAVPVGHITKYPDNLREKLDGLPWDFSSLIAPTEKAYTATRNYTAGSLLIVNNILYKVTANIANGGAITPNTNVVATTLSEVISVL